MSSLTKTQYSRINKTKADKTKNDKKIKKNVVLEDKSFEKGPQISSYIGSRIKGQ